MVERRLYTAITVVRFRPGVPVNAALAVMVQALR